MDPRVEKIVHQAQEFAQTLTLYHYVFFILIFFIFVVLMILGFMSAKRLGLSLFLIFTAFIFVGTAPFGVDTIVNSTIRATKVTSLRLHHFSYIDDSVISGTLIHTGQVPYTQCTMNSYIVDSPLRDELLPLYFLKPVKYYEEIHNVALNKGDEYPFRVVLSNSGMTKYQRAFISVECR